MIDKLHYISTAAADGTHLTNIRQALSSGCKWIQLRIKDRPLDHVLSCAFKASALCESFGARLIVNDYPGVALAVNAYGLHLGLDDIAVAEARAIVGDRLVIGGTANTIEHIKQRASEGVDYIGLGPLRFTATKQKLSPLLGLAGYHSIIAEAKALGIHIPVIAIGGINVEDIPALMLTGVHGVAMSGAIRNAEDPAKTVAIIYEHLNASHIKLHQKMISHVTNS